MLTRTLLLVLVSLFTASCWTLESVSERPDGGAECNGGTSCDEPERCGDGRCVDQNDALIEHRFRRVGFDGITEVGVAIDANERLLVHTQGDGVVFAKTAMETPNVLYVGTDLTGNVTTFAARAAAGSTYYTVTTTIDPELVVGHVRADPQGISTMGTSPYALVVTGTGSQWAEDYRPQHFYLEPPGSIGTFQEASNSYGDQILFEFEGELPPPAEAISDGDDGRWVVFNDADGVLHAWDVVQDGFDRSQVWDTGADPPVALMEVPTPFSDAALARLTAEKWLVAVVKDEKVSITAWDALLGVQVTHDPAGNSWLETPGITGLAAAGTPNRAWLFWTDGSDIHVVWLDGDLANGMPLDLGSAVYTPDGGFEISELVASSGDGRVAMGWLGESGDGMAAELVELSLP